MIVFLGIHAKVNPLLIFVLINTTDLFCLFISGPLAAFLKKKNRQLLRHHQKAGKYADDDFGFESFIKWVKVKSSSFRKHKQDMDSGSFKVETLIDQMLLRGIGQIYFYDPGLYHSIWSQCWTTFFSFHP